MFNKSWALLALAAMLLLGCGGARDPYGQQVQKVTKYTDRGDEWFSKGDLKRASKEFQRGLELSRSVDYQTGEAVQINNLGAVALEQGDLPRARKLFSRAWQINQNQENWTAASTNQANLATVAAKAGDKAGVTQHLTLAEKAARRSGSKAALGRIFIRWAAVSLDQLDFGGAEAYLNLAKPLAKTTALKASVAHQRGRLALARGDTWAALNYFTLALERDREVLDRAAIAADLFALGNTSRLRRDWSKAFDYYARAFYVYASLGRKARLQDCLTRLREANQEGALNQSLERFEKHPQLS